MNKIVLPSRSFQTLLQTLTESPGKTLYCRLGIDKQKDVTNYLLREIIDSETEIRGRYIIVSTTTEFISISDWLTNHPDTGAIGYLIFGKNDCEGHWWGAITEKSGDLVPIREILLVGSEMLRLKMSTFSKEDQEVTHSLDTPIFRRFSRTIGAIGKETWQRLTG